MSSVRKRGVVVTRPIVYGSIAYFLGKRAEETKTHRWHIYVRGLQNEDLSYMIQKVVISLHSSFEVPIRVLTEAPFEVSEYGWGEFEVKIQIHFHDLTEQPIDIKHLLKLYPTGTMPASTKRPVVHEYYDELVFNEPTEFFYKKLLSGPEGEAPQHPSREFFPTYSERNDLEVLTKAQEFLREQIERTKEDLLTTDEANKRLREEIADWETNKKPVIELISTNPSSSEPTAAGSETPSTPLSTTLNQVLKTSSSISTLPKISGTSSSNTKDSLNQAQNKASTEASVVP